MAYIYTSFPYIYIYIYYIIIIIIIIHIYILLLSIRKRFTTSMPCRVFTDIQTVYLYRANNNHEFFDNIINNH